MGDEFGIARPATHLSMLPYLFFMDRCAVARSPRVLCCRRVHSFLKDQHNSRWPFVRMYTGLLSYRRRQRTDANSGDVNRQVLPLGNRQGASPPQIIARFLEGFVRKNLLAEQAAERRLVDQETPLVATIQDRPSFRT
jgi:hypothetical protein